MNAELTRRIDLARIEARRRRHDAAEPEHLLAAVLELQDVSEALRNRGMDPIELREKLDARLMGKPAVGGYRDGSDVPLSPTLERVIQRLEPRRWRSLGARMSIVEALLPERAIAALLFELRRGNDHRHILQRAAALATMSEHASVGVEHAFRVLLDLRSFVETVERAGGGVDRLRAEVDELLAAAARSSTPCETPRIGPVMRRVVSTAETMARRAGTAMPTVRQFCLELARQDESERFWTAAGIDASAFVRAIHIPDERSLRARGLLR